MYCSSTTLPEYFFASHNQVLYNLSHSKYKDIMKRISLIPIIFLLLISIAGCNEPPNPLIGQWQHSAEGISSSVQRIEFTPSTMRIDDQVVTVVYQVRDNKVRVSASKMAIIYEFDNADSIHYEDEKHGTVRLTRIKP
jgi:hypothetical protein